MGEAIRDVLARRVKRDEDKGITATRERKLVKKVIAEKRKLKVKERDKRDKKVEDSRRRKRGEY